MKSNKKRLRWRTKYYTRIEVFGYLLAACLAVIALGFLIFIFIGTVRLYHTERVEREQSVASCHSLIVETGYHTGRYDVREVSAKLPVPKLELDVSRYDPIQGWGINAQVTDFVFAPESLNGTHSDGEGYLRWYIDGVLQGRQFGESWYIHPITFNNKNRPTLVVELVANDHSVYTKDGSIICAATRLLPEIVDGLNPFELLRISAKQDVITNTGYVTVSTSVPSVSVNVVSDNDSGWLVRAVPERFALNSHALGKKHVPGEGHMLLLIDGVARQIVFNEWTELPYLEDGEHTVEVLLRSNDQRILVSDGKPIGDEVTFFVETDSTTHSNIVLD